MPPLLDYLKEARLFVCGLLAFIIALDGGKRSNMDKSRKANREGNETTLQYKSQQEILLEAELYQDKLTKLLAAISQLEETSRSR